MVKKHISIPQAIRLAKKFNVHLTEESFSKVKHGDFLFKRLNEETGKETFYFLRRIFMQKFTMGYSAHKDIKSGGELLISSLPMPDIKKYI